jgi:hypothetical protein
MCACTALFDNPAYWSAGYLQASMTVWATLLSVQRLGGLAFCPKAGAKKYNDESG